MGRRRGGWTLGKLTFRRHLADRGFGAKKGSGGQRLVQGLRLKGGFGARPESGAMVLGKLDDGRTIRDDGIGHDPIDAHIVELIKKPPDQSVAAAVRAGGVLAPSK